MYPTAAPPMNGIATAMAAGAASHDMTRRCPRTAAETRCGRGREAGAERTRRERGGGEEAVRTGRLLFAAEEAGECPGREKLDACEHHPEERRPSHEAAQDRHRRGRDGGPRGSFPAHRGRAPGRLPTAGGPRGR